MFLKFFPQRDFEDKCLKVYLIYLYILPSNFFSKREWEVLFTFSLVDISDLVFFPPLCGHQPLYLFMIQVDCNFSWRNSHKIKMYMSPLLPNNNMEELFTPSSMCMPSLPGQLYFAWLRESHRTWLNCHKSYFLIFFYFLRF